MRKPIIVSLMLACLLTVPASSQQVYLRNHPFKGKTSGQGKELQVSLKDLAAAAGLTVTQVGSGWVVGPPPASGGEDVKGVWVMGTEVTAHQEDGEELVNL